MRCLNKLIYIIHGQGTCRGNLSHDGYAMGGAWVSVEKLWACGAIEDDMEKKKRTLIPMSIVWLTWRKRNYQILEEEITTFPKD